MINFILLFVLLIISVIDIKTKHIPDLITVPGILAGLVYNHFALNSIFGIVAGIGIVHCLNTLKIFRLSGGDAKLMGMFGAFLGWQAVLIILGMSILLSLPYKVYRLIENKEGSFVYSPLITMASLILFLYAR